MLEFQNISFQYPQDKQPMMQNLSFSVEDGAFISIIGASGCGKSTIFRLINGLENPQKGTIFVNGKPISDDDLKELIGHTPLEVLGGVIIGIATTAGFLIW